MIISSNLFQNKQDWEQTKQDESDLKNDEDVHFGEARGLDTVKNTRRHTHTNTHIKYSVIYYDLTFKKKTTKCIFVEC